MNYQTYTTPEGEQIRVYRTNNDVNGNPRYIVHFLDLGLKDYFGTNKTRNAGLKMYRGKDFGGGFVFQSYNIDSTLDFVFKTLERR